MTFTDLPKDDTVEELRSISEKLNSYYDNISDILKENILYLVKNNPEGNNQLMQCATDPNNGQHYLIFDSNDISEIHDSIIAHEFQHLVMRNNGFPFTTPVVETNQHRKISSAINNLLQHKQIYEFLTNKGYTAKCDYFKTNIETLKETIGFNGNNPLILSPIGSKIFMLLYADHYNIQKTISENFYDNNPIADFIHEHYYSIDRGAIRILNRMKERGCGTKEQQIDFLKDIVSQFSLIDIVNGHYIEGDNVISINFNDE